MGAIFSLLLNSGGKSDYRAGESNVEIRACSGHKSHYTTVGTDSGTFGIQRVATSIQVLTHCFQQTKGVNIRVMVAFWA